MKYYVADDKYRITNYSTNYVETCIKFNELHSSYNYLRLREITNNYRNPKTILTYDSKE